MATCTASQALSPAPSTAPRRRGGDPRPYQIAVLTALLFYGVGALDMSVGVPTVAVLLGTALLSQWLWTRIVGLPRFDPKSALISGLSLCLLLRTGSLWVASLAALLAISSKFLLRFDGRHVWNPTNFALVMVLLLPVDGWASPGQWGSFAFFAALLVGLGGLVVMRAERGDVTWAFLTAWATLLFGRAAWLGDPLAIPLHQLQSGGLLIFAFLMISDPKTTPDSRGGRIAYACAVAALAGWIQFGLYRPNGLLWALALGAPLVPLLNRCLPGRLYAWPQLGSSQLSTQLPQLVSPTTSEVHPMSQPTSIPRPLGWRRLLLPALAFVLLSTILTRDARAFCGFYVAKADTSLFNQASKVVLTRQDDRTVITMVNDFQGEVAEFAMVVPVPTFLERHQIHVGDRAVIEHLDAYTSPRLVEYFDADPCRREERYRRQDVMASESAPMADGAAQKARSLGVTIEAQYTVGEYDILILSAKESHGLETWLRDSGYRLPEGAARVLGSYIRQDMRFFVAKVNLEQQQSLGFTYLRPLQVAYESPKLMLPIRLGTVNADGPQELFVFVLSPEGRVETTNYRTVKLPTDVELPVFVKGEFDTFYRDMFSHQVKKERQRAVFLEYAWDMAWCDPCAADPLSRDELRQLGVFWLPEGDRGQAQNVYVTRLHVRYSAETFPEDLVFQQTTDRSNFQGRYILRHPWTGDGSEVGGRCAAARQYRQQVAQRQEREAQQLVALTGWDIADVRRRLPTSSAPIEDDTDADPWWKKLWGTGGR